MGIAGSIILFLLIWWIIFFISLPLNIQNNKKKVDNIGIEDPGAPNNPQIFLKFAFTTFISLILWGIIYWTLNDDGFLMYIINLFYTDEVI